MSLIGTLKIDLLSVFSTGLVWFDWWVQRFDLLVFVSANMSLLEGQNNMKD